MIRFTKMQGIGNDYVYVNGFEQSIDEPSELAVEIADRHFGVGGDGLILLLPPEPDSEADVRMRMFNADGSESEMCGNGLRCVCKLAHDLGIATRRPMRVQTGRGVLSLEYDLDEEGLVRDVTVDMGEPILNLADVPVIESKIKESEGSVHTFEAHGIDFHAVFVSMGNPHAVIFARDIAAVNLQAVGPVLETHEAFPHRMNIHFAHVHGRSEITMRTWERGSGITLACGTGASAVCVAAVLAGLTDREVLTHLPGGDLTIRWDEATNHVFMTGPAVEVFRGEWRGVPVRS